MKTLECSVLSPQEGNDGVVIATTHMKQASRRGKSVLVNLSRDV
jgi:hypothetical protein